MIRFFLSSSCYLIIFVKIKTEQDLGIGFALNQKLSSGLTCSSSDSDLFFILCQSLAQKEKGYSFLRVISKDCYLTLILLYSFSSKRALNLGYKTSGGIGLLLKTVFKCALSSACFYSISISNLLSLMLFGLVLSLVSNAKGFGIVVANLGFFLRCYYLYYSTVIRSSLRTCSSRSKLSLSKS